MLASPRASHCPKQTCTSPCSPFPGPGVGSGRAPPPRPRPAPAAPRAKLRGPHGQLHGRSQDTDLRIQMAPPSLPPPPAAYLSRSPASPHPTPPASPGAPLLAPLPPLASFSTFYHCRPRHHTAAGSFYPLFLRLFFCGSPQSARGAAAAAAQARHRQLRSARPASRSALFRQLSLPLFLLDGTDRLAAALQARGVVSACQVGGRPPALVARSAGLPTCQAVSPLHSTLPPSPAPLRAARLRPTARPPRPRRARRAPKAPRSEGSLPLLMNMRDWLAATTEARRRRARTDGEDDQVAAGVLAFNYSRLC